MAKPRRDPLRFEEFAERVGVELTDGQLEVARVLFDGEDADAGGGIFGFSGQPPEGARGVAVAVCGARAGKSYILGALRLVHLALTVPLVTLAPGELAVGVVVAPDMRLAGQTQRYVRGILTHGFFGNRVRKGLREGMVLERDDGEVSLECLPATVGGGALRGRSLVGAVLDEAAFFRDDTFRVNDVDVFRALAPRVMRGGQVVVVSTPWAESGLLWDLWRENWARPRAAVVAHAPTWRLRSDPHTVSYVERERGRDPTNARREFGAEFLATDEGSFFDARAIDAALRASWDIRKPVVRVAGADFGFRRDSSALVVVERTEARFRVLAVEELLPQGGPLIPSTVVARFCQICAEHGVTEIVADSHYVESVREHAQARGVAVTRGPEGSAGKAASYQYVRHVLHEGELVLPQEERLVRQMKEVTSRPTAGGAVSIQSPRWRSGGHGDIVSAMVLGLWRLRWDRPDPEARERTIEERLGADAQERKRKVVERQRARYEDDCFDLEEVLGSEP